MQLQNALQNSNATVGGDYVNQGEVAMTVRSVGLFGGGADPVKKVLGMKNPVTAATILRAEEQRRIRDIRSLVIASVNNQPVRVEDVVEGGRTSEGELGERGVVVSHQTRLGRVGYWKPDKERPSGSTQTIADPKIGHDEPDVVECIVLLRKNEETLPALKDVKAKVNELNDSERGRMLPGTKIEPYYDRTELLNITTDTVTENLLMGDRARGRRAVHVRQQYPHGGHRGHQHSAGIVVRLHGALRAGQIREPAFDRGGRFRHHRRLVGHHGREHLSESGGGQLSRACRSRSVFCGSSRRSTEPCCSRR